MRESGEMDSLATSASSRASYSTFSWKPGSVEWAGKMSTMSRAARVEFAGVVEGPGGGEEPENHAGDSGVHP